VKAIFDSEWEFDDAIRAIVAETQEYVDGKPDNNDLQQAWSEVRKEFDEADKKYRQLESMIENQSAINPDFDQTAIKEAASDAMKQQLSDDIEALKKALGLTSDLPAGNQSQDIPL